MTSDRAAPPGEAFVWIWLPDAVEPVVAGRLARDGELYSFNYGQSYLARRDANSDPACPNCRCGAAPIAPTPPFAMAGCLRDGAPDAWGRRVIVNRLTGLGGEAARDVEFDELTFLLNSGSDRSGALDFQVSAETYTPREPAGHAGGIARRGEPCRAGRADPARAGSRAVPRQLDRRRAAQGADRGWPGQVHRQVLGRGRYLRRDQGRVRGHAPSRPGRSGCSGGAVGAGRRKGRASGETVRPGAGRGRLDAPGGRFGPHHARPGRDAGALGQLWRSGRSYPRPVLKSQGHLARTVRPHGVQRSGRQQRRSRAQPRRLLEWPMADSDAGLRHLPPGAHGEGGQSGNVDRWR